jgi:hypothetical protein
METIKIFASEVIGTMVMKFTEFSGTMYVHLVTDMIYRYI